MRTFYSRFRKDERLPPKPIIRKTKITAAMGLKIKQIVRENPRLGMMAIANQLPAVLLDENAKISATSVHQYLREQEFKSVTPISEMCIRPANIEKRKAFAGLHIGKDKNWWRNVMWSNETSIVCYPEAKNIQIWVHSSTLKDKKPSIPRIQEGGFKVMFWGSFSGHHCGPLRVVDGTLDSRKYLEILQEEVLSEIEVSLEPLIVMQDNAPAHSAKVVKDWFSAHRVPTLE